MNQQTRRPMTRPARKNRSSMDTTSKVLIVAFVVIGIILAIVGGNFVFNLVKGWSLTDLPGAPVASGNNSNNVVGGTPLQTSKGPDPVSWDGKSRVNILLLGLDYSSRRQNEGQGSPLSDTMILVTVDPLSRTIGAMSIRRDLWVNIPGFDYNKINSAYKLGEDYQIPGGGPGLAMETVEGLLGIPIDYYARVDLNTFVTVIDEIGGVPITLTQRMLLDWEGNGNKFWIEPGYYILPGSHALAYARTRDAEYGDGDIARGNRQMEVVMAIRDRVLNVNALPNLIAKAPTLYQTISAGLQTNMSLDQAIQLAWLVVQIPRENMRTFNMDYTVASPENTSDGIYILRPIPDQLRLLRDQMFTSTGVAAAPIVIETTTGQAVDPQTLSQDETASIEVLNGTSTGGLADTTAAYLTSQGLTVASTGNTDLTDSTTIIVHNSKPYTLAFLATLMQVSQGRIYNQLDPNSGVDITVNLGNDWANSNPMP